MEAHNYVVVLFKCNPFSFVRIYSDVDLYICWQEFSHCSDKWLLHSTVYINKNEFNINK